MLEDGTIQKISRPNGGVSVRILREGEWRMLAYPLGRNRHYPYASYIQMIVDHGGIVLENISDAKQGKRLQSGLSQHARKVKGLKITTSYNPETHTVVAMVRDSE